MSMASSTISSVPIKDEITLLSLPLETQKHIIRNVERKDLFTIQTLCRHFHGLASAELYRDLKFTITSSETDDTSGSPARAAEALQTILTSEHDYAQHIKKFQMGVIEDRAFSALGSTIHDPLLMAHLLWDSKRDPSKFLNTTVLLMVRRATILETFKWDAPVELSGAVYQALHKITSLRHLRVRLDVQPSPKIGIQRQYPTGSHATGINYPPHPPYIPASTNISSAQNPHASAGDSVSTKRKKAGASRFWTNRRSFAGFKTLNTLEIVGISNLDCLPEVAQCIQASCACLKSLTLTLSAELAKKARKPNTTTIATTADDATDTELEDDEDVLDPTSLPPVASSQPVNEADIREEKTAQEGILATVFDLQDVASAGKRLEKRLSLSGVRLLDKDEPDIRAKVDNLLKYLHENPTSSPDQTSLAARLEKYKLLRELTSLYITNASSHDKKPTKSQSKSQVPSGKSTSKPLNPMASGFQPSNPSKSIDQMDETLSAAMSSPIGPPFGIGSAGAKTSSVGYIPGSGDAPILPPVSSYSGTEDGKPSLAEMQSHLSADGDSYMSPYSSGSNLGLSHPIDPYSYGYSPSGTGKHTSLPPIGSSFTYQPYTNGKPDGQATLNPPLDGTHSKNIALWQGAKFPKKKHFQKVAEPVKSIDVAESDDDADSDTPTKAVPISQQQFFAATPTGEADDSMDVDMEHPDEDVVDSGDDQEIIAGAEDVDIPKPRKRIKKNSQATPAPVSVGRSQAPVEDSSRGADLKPTEAMQNYVRAAHGLQLDELRLHYIPLKPSIVGRALDLTVLRRLTLLEVGSQDAFWTLLVKLTSPDLKIAFKSIHTDNVSIAFLKFLATFESLEELYMHERLAKSEPDSTVNVNISVICKMALRPHIDKLKRLMIRNDRDESWDVDMKTLHYLTLRGKHLRELAISLKMQNYHLLIQWFPAFEKLHALHIISLRSHAAERIPASQMESLDFAIDSLSHWPEAKLSYIAIGEQVTKLEENSLNFSEHLGFCIDRHKTSDSKGKGKAVNFLDNLDILDDSDFETTFAEVSAGARRKKFSTQFDRILGVKIFSKKIRTGRL